MIKVEAAPELEAHIIAGRRACMLRLRELVAETGGTFSGVQPEHAANLETTHISVCGLDITVGIDAAILETVVRMQHPDRPAAPAKRRKWWRVW